jgi:hypothetical protein
MFWTIEPASGFAAVATVFLVGDVFEVFDLGVEVGEEFSGTSDDGYFGWFAVGAQSQVKGLEGRGFLADGAQGGHVEGAAQLVAPTVDKTHAMFLSAVLGKGSQAAEGGDLFAVRAF